MSNIKVKAEHAHKEIEVNTYLGRLKYKLGNLTKEQLNAFYKQGFILSEYLEGLEEEKPKKRKRKSNGRSTVQSNVAESDNGSAKDI